MLSSSSTRLAKSSKSLLLGVYVVSGASKIIYSCLTYNSTVIKPAFSSSRPNLNLSKRRRLILTIFSSLADLWTDAGIITYYSWLPLHLPD